MKDFLLILGIMAVCGWITAIPLLFFRNGRVPARLRLRMMLLPLGMLLIPLPFFCRRTVTLPSAMSPQIGVLSSERIPVTPGDPLPSPLAAEPVFTIGAELIAAVWLIGMVLCLLMQLSSLLMLKRYLAERKTVPAEMHTVLTKLCADMKIRQSPRLAFCPEIDTPLLAGILRPVILLPEEKYTTSELRLILQHELTHYKHGHLLLQAAARLAAAIHWFHPLGYLLLKQIPAACEDACDEIVSAVLTQDERKHYGLIILRFAGSHSYGGCAAFASPRESLISRKKDPRQYMERRLKAVMNPKHISGKVKLLAASIAALLLFGSCGLSYKIAPTAVKQQTAPASDVTAEPADKSSESMSSETSELDGEDVPSEEGVSPEEKLPYSSEEASEPSLEPEKSHAEPNVQKEKLESVQAEPETQKEDLKPTETEPENIESEYMLENTAATVYPLPGYRTITANFGEHYGNSHDGIDISGENVIGAAIVAYAAGEVVTAEYDAKKGNYIVIDHGNDITTVYAHCESLTVKTGDVVAAGQTIATVGTTGMSTGPHLHFEVWLNGSPVNPNPYLGL